MLIHLDDTGSAATEYAHAGVEWGELYVYLVKAQYGDVKSRHANYVNMDTTGRASPTTG